MQKYQKQVHIARLLYIGTRHTLCLGREQSCFGTLGLVIHYEMEMEQSCFGTLGLVIHYVWGGNRVILVLWDSSYIMSGEERELF